MQKDLLFLNFTLNEGFSGTHGQNEEGGWKQGREVGLAGTGKGGEKMQTTVIEQQ